MVLGVEQLRNIELIAREKQTYMHAYGRVTCDVIDVDGGNEYE